MAPPRGIGFCWYWLAKLYSPIVPRMPSSVSLDFTVGLEHFIGFALEPSSPPGIVNEMNLVFFSDGGKRKDFPVLLAHHMADQVILVKSLHDDNDDAVFLAV
jgi:hypothetical protein